MMTGNVLMGDEFPRPAPQEAVHQELQADAKTLSAMTVHELRIALRARGLSPAGSKVTLVDRLLAGIAAGVTPLMVSSKQYNAGLDSTQLSVAYARSEGAPLPEGVASLARASSCAMHSSHHVAAALNADAAAVAGNGDAGDDATALVSPSGRRVNEAALAQMASHFSLSSDDAAAAAGDDSHGGLGPVKAAHPRRLADGAGHNVFTPEAQSTKQWLPGKQKDYAGNGIFDADAEQSPAMSGRTTLAKLQEMASHVVSDSTGIAAFGELPPPAALSSARSAELSGEGVFAVAKAPLPQPPGMTAAALANLSSSVFIPESSPAGDASNKASPGSAEVQSGRARNHTSQCFSEEFLAAQPAKEPAGARAKHVEELYSQQAGLGATMNFAQGDPNPPVPVARQSARRSSGGGVSSIVLG